MSLFARAQSYERYTTAYDADGIAQTTPTAVGTFRGTIQPMPARANKEPKDLASGRFDAGRVRVYSTTPLKVGTEGGTRGDVVLFNGQRFEVIKDIAHQMGVIPHYKYIAEYVGEVEA